MGQPSGSYKHGQPAHPQPYDRGASSQSNAVPAKDFASRIDAIKAKLEANGLEMARIREEEAEKSRKLKAQLAARQARRNSNI